MPAHRNLSPRFLSTLLACSQHQQAIATLGAFHSPTTSNSAPVPAQAAKQTVRHSQDTAFLKDTGSQVQYALSESYVLSICHIEHEGWMVKRPVKGFGGVKNRYFHLCKGILRYYTDQTSKQKDPSKPKGALKLTASSVVTHKFVGGINKGWYLQVSVDANRTLVAQVKSKAVAEEWLSKLNETIARIQSVHDGHDDEDPGSMARRDTGERRPTVDAGLVPRHFEELARAVNEVEEYEVESSDLYRKVALVAPAVFRRLRAHCSISEKRFINLMTNFSTPGSSGAGRSGAYFFYGKHRTLILKSMTKTEMDVLKVFLADYYNHIAAYPDSLLCRFLCVCELYPIKNSNKPEMLLCMQNLLTVNNPDGLNMTELYDLKGSSVNRKVKKGVVLKDRNFIENRGGEKRQRNLVYSGGHYGGLLVSPAHQEKLMKQLALDTDLLRQHSIMDYSLLLGISEPQGTHTYTYQEQARQRKAHNDGLGTGRPHALLPMPSCREPWMLPHDEAFGGRTKEMYWVGIIDILQKYDASKAAERAAKLAVINLSQNQPDTNISSIAAPEYCERFMQFIEEHCFPAITPRIFARADSNADRVFLEGCLQHRADLMRLMEHFEHERSSSDQE
eukprot:INCI17785.4.p1 GENE.INCI17785.4~~INCI17785.4.p1  ORF type:complete len:618 (+),score=95.38 INCI17785.4:135-1988(+)